MFMPNLCKGAQEFASHRLLRSAHRHSSPELADKAEFAPSAAPLPHLIFINRSPVPAWWLNRMIKRANTWDTRSTISRWAHVLERTGLALTGASCGLFVAAHVARADIDLIA